jgi:ketosteroid isomerase-like protein
MTSPSPPPSSGTPVSEAELAEDRFFQAILAGDAEQLERVLEHDFLIVDVMRGAVVDRASFIEAFRARSLAFDRVDVVERLSRRHGDTVIIVGRTEMSGSFSGADFAVAGRYTPRFIRDCEGQWCLTTAQGTPITDA